MKWLFQVILINSMLVNFVDEYEEQCKRIPYLCFACGKTGHHHTHYQTDHGSVIQALDLRNPKRTPSIDFLTKRKSLYMYLVPHLISIGMGVNKKGAA
jgi:hypothetical protein